MKNLFKLILLLLIPIVGILILSYPGVWKYRVENIINRKVLKETGWNLSIGKIDGHLLKQVESHNVKITHDNGTDIWIPKLNAQFNMLRLLSGDLHLKETNISDFDLQVSNQENGDKTVLKLPDLNYSKFPVTIDRLIFNGILNIIFSDTTHRVSIDFLGSIHPRSTGLNINIDSLGTKHVDLKDNFTIADTKINIHNRQITINPLGGTFADVKFGGELKFSQSEKQNLSGNINLANIVIPERLFAKTPLQVKFSEFNSNIKFDTDFANYSGVVSLNNNLGLDMIGDFNVTKQPNRWLAQQILLQGESAQLFVHGDMINNSRINASIDLDHLDLSQWLKQQQITNISGNANLETIIEDGNLNYAALELKTQESALFEKDTILVNGAFVYENGQINIPDSLNIVVGPSSVNAIGSVNFTNKELDLDLNLRNADVFIVNNFWSDSLKNGTIAGDIKLSGDINNPEIVGNVIGKNIKYRDFQLSEIELDGRRLLKNNNYGFAKVKLAEAQWKNLEVDSGNLDVTFKNNEIHFNNLDFKNNNDYLISSGVIDTNNVFHIEKIKSSYDQHYFTNITPISIGYNNNGIKISSFRAQLDDGEIEGEIIYNKLVNGSLKFSNIESEIFHPFIQDSIYHFTGSSSGEISFYDSNRIQNYNINLSLKNGKLIQEPFNFIDANMTYTNQVLEIANLVITENDSSLTEINGFIPFGKTRKTDSVELNTKFSNTNINTITQFIPDWFAMSGKIYGDLNVVGTGGKMNSTYNVTIQDATFDKIAFGTVKSSGVYDGKKININTFSSDLNNDHFTGYGYFPIDLNIHSDNFANIAENDSLYIFLEGKSTNLDFITVYFDEVDRVQGKYELNLELTGIWDRIIRNGSVEARDATLFTPLLDDPIANLKGFVTIENNQFKIDNFTGKMHRNGRRVNRKKENITISGGMDITSVFEPQLNFKAEGKEAYFRSLIYEIEGISDFNVSITGQDTILITGEAAVIDVEMFQDLVANELGILPEEDGTTTIQYKMDFPIKGKLTLTNDQLDIDLIGDVSINQIGDREADYAGELSIEQGEFYYYGDVFTITEGSLTFDNHGFNPFLDISANTTIDKEQINVNITGNIENPILTFTSESGFSQSDILELLTWRKKFEEQDQTTEGIRKQASGLVLSWFGSQLDRNIIELSGLNQLGILENVDIRGTSGLLTAGEDFEISAPISQNVAFNYAYRRPFGLQESRHKLGVELRLNRYLSLVGNIDRSGYMHVKYRLRYAH